MINISIEGMDAVKARFASLVPALKARALAGLAQKVHDDVQDGADRHTRPASVGGGQLARSVFLRQVSEDAWEVGHDTQMAPHALFVVWGTKPHTIYPSKRKALRWPSGGGFVFAKSVSHPGYKGDNYLQKAARDAPGHMAGIVDALRRDL